MRHLNTDQFIGLLMGLKDRKDVAAIITTRTEPAMRKKNNPHLGVAKFSDIKVVLNYNYKERVNKQLVSEGREPDFTPTDRVWGEHDKGTPLIRKADGVYVDVLIEKPLGHEYRKGNQKIEESALAPFLQRSSSTRQGTENQVIVRTYKATSIVGIELHDDAGKPIESYVINHL